MSSSNDYKPQSYYFPHQLSENSQPKDCVNPLTSSLYSETSTPPLGVRPHQLHGWQTFSTSTDIPNRSCFSIDSQTTHLIEGQNQLKTAFDFLSKHLEKPKQNNQTFETNILKELKQMKEEMANIKRSIEELPIRFADALSQCLDSVNSRSETASVDSEPEIIDILDKIESIDEIKEDDHLFELTDKCVVTSKLFQNKVTVEKCDSIVDKFVFEYNPYIDLDKWLKKE